ncbi:related to hydrolases of the alpha beta superfamily, partial [Lecanosticta acicola]
LTRLPFPRLYYAKQLSSLSSSNMPRRDIEFETSDGVILRGWFYRSPDKKGKLPCLVMAHGFSALKEMDLDAFAEHFTSKLPLTCLVYDNRGFGASDAAQGQPRQEIVPSLQMSDYSDAITYAQSLDDVDGSKIGIWGSSYSGGHVLQIGAADKRVKAVLSQVPLVNGFENFSRLVRSDQIPDMYHLWQEDRISRMKGEEARTVPIVTNQPQQPAALPTPDSYDFFTAWEKKSDWKNHVTVRSLELLRAHDPSHLIHRIAPTPLLMTVAANDVLTPTDLALEAYSRAREPKQLSVIPGGHFDAYRGVNFERNAGTQTDFLRETLCVDVRDSS